MPRKRRSRNKNFTAIPFSTEIALGTLGNDTFLGVEPGNFGEDIWITSVDVYATLRDGTSGEQPLEVVLAHGDYTAGEIVECLDANAFDPNDKIAVEKSRRKVRKIGMFSGATDERLNDGKKIRVKCGFIVGSGKSIELGAVNRSGASLTTGAVIDFQGTIFGNWKW